MSMMISSRLRKVSGTVFVLGFVLSSTVFGQVSAADSEATDSKAAKKASKKTHTHRPIIVHTRPMVHRYQVPLLRPRRLLVTKDGTIFVADWAAGTIVRITPDLESSLFSSGLYEPAGLALDSLGNLYVSTHAGGMTGAGEVYKISSEGDKELFATGFSGPTGLAFDANGDLYVADFHGDTISRVTPDGEVSTFAPDIIAPSDLVFDRKGNLYVCSSTMGIVYKISGDGRSVKALAHGLSAPSDLAFDSKGHLIVANFGYGTLSHVTPNGDVKTFGVVPKGAIAIAFDADDNLLVANWSGHYLMKVKSTIYFKCPHCKRMIPVRFQSKKAGKSESPRSKKLLPKSLLPTVTL